MPHGYMRSLMWWVPTISFTLQRESGALLVEVMICLIQVPQIIGLWVSGGPVRRKHGNHKIHLTTSFTDLFHRGCFDNAEFQRVADDCFDLWFANRDSGFAGLSSFVGTMYACASTFLTTHVIVATTARQRLELALTTMRLLERHPIDERRLSRLCTADPDLSAIVELHVDLNVFDSISVPPHVFERLAERCRRKRTLFSLKPLPGLIFCLIQLRGSEDTDNMKRHCNLLNDSNKGCLLP